ncbi:MAG: hypothetical protein Q8K65_11940 [Alphaproteobacteria bacterium]|nr:hypothetical protein [Alphaproteobacteria bacterium]
MASRRPDFRNMTPDEIKKGISSLNRDIRALRAQVNRTTGKFFIGQAATVGVGVPATLIFPPLGLGIMAAGMIHGVEKSAESSVQRAQLAEAESLRKSFKAVWRARPGRPFRDVDARNKREAERRADKERNKILNQYNRKFGFGP